MDTRPVIPATSAEALAILYQVRPEWKDRFSRCSDAIKGDTITLFGHPMLVSSDRSYFFLQDDNQDVETTNRTRMCSNVPADYNNAVCFIQFPQSGDICFSLAFHPEVCTPNGILSSKTETE